MPARRLTAGVAPAQAGVQSAMPHWGALQLGSRPSPGLRIRCQSLRCFASCSWTDASLRSRVDLSFPALEQALALRRRSVLGGVVVDQLDVGKTRHLRRQRNRAVGRYRVLLDVETDLLRFLRQRPVEEFLRVVQ